MKFTYRRKPVKSCNLKDRITEYINKRRLRIYPEYVYKYFSSRRWKFPSGKTAKSVEGMVDYLNGVFLSTQPLPPATPPSRAKRKPKPKKEKWTTYEEQLQDPRWSAFREKVFQVRGHKCEKCGSEEIIQVHHPKYITGRKAWEYSTDEVIVLCRKCHREVHGLTEDNNDLKEAI